MTKEELNELTGTELLRLIVQNCNTTRESFNDQYSFVELIQIHIMFLLSDRDIYPDEWTKRQVKEALGGLVPQWTKGERPKYSKKNSKRMAIDLGYSPLLRASMLVLEKGSWQEKTGCETPNEAGQKIQDLENKIEELKAELHCASHNDKPES